MKNEDPIYNENAFGSLQFNAVKRLEGFKSSPENIKESPFDEDVFKTKLSSGIELGDHRDKLSRVNLFDPSINVQAAVNNQRSFIEKAQSLTESFSATLLTGAAQGILGSLYGITEIADNRVKDPENFSLLSRKSFNTLFDNKLNRYLDEQKEAIDAKSSLFIDPRDGFGFNWKTAKGISDGFAFIGSAALTEIVYTPLTLSLGQGMAGARLAGYSKKLGQLGKVFRSADDLARLEKHLLDKGLDDLVNGMASYKQQANLLAASTQMGGRLLTTTAYESGLEGRRAGDEYLEAMMERLDERKANSDMSDAEYNAEKIRIEEDAEKVKTTTFLMNSAILSVSNTLQFPRLFGFGNKYVNKKATGKIIRDGLGKVKPKVGRANVLKNVGRVLKNPVTEFMEETGQYFSAEYTKNYYELMMSADGEAGVLNGPANAFASAVWKGLRDTYGSDEGIFEGQIGAVIGMVGIPGFRKGKKGISWQGGIVEPIRNIREENQYAKDAAEALNSQNISDVLQYNKDQAVIATLDGQREDIAAISDDPIELEAIEDNRVFRYTVDRLKKGLDTFIQDDIQELSNMDLDTYKQTFGKDDSFTQEEKDAEVNNFRDKVAVYSDAFHKVHKTFSAGALPDDRISNKLIDVLTHSVATEKIYRDRLEKLKQRILSINLDDLSPEEREEFIRTSEQIAEAQAEINRYAAERQGELDTIRGKQVENETERLQAALEKELDPEYRYLTNLRLDELEVAKKDILDTTKDSVEKFEELEGREATAEEKKAIKEQAGEPVELDANQKKSLEQIEKAIDYHKAQEKAEDAIPESKFDIEKSPKMDKYKEELAKLSKEINTKIENARKGAMGQITKPKSTKKLTTQELEKYLAQRKKIADAINKEIGSEVVLDIISNDLQSGEDLMREMIKITNMLVNASDVASYLFGFRNDPYRAYTSIIRGELLEDLQGLSLDRILLSLLAQNSNDINSQEIQVKVQELKDRVERIERKLLDLEETGALNEFMKEAIDSEIEEAKQFLSEFEDLVQTTIEVDKQARKAQLSQEDPNTSDDDEKDIDKQPIQDDGESSTIKKTPKALLEEKRNRLVIKEVDVNDPEADAVRKEFSEKLNDGTIQNKSAVVLKVIEEELNLEANPYLKAKLEKLGLYDNYMAGLAKVEADPTLLYAKNMDQYDLDVYTFLRFAPVNMSILNKKLNAAEENDGTYDLSEEELNDVVFSQYLFETDDIRNFDTTELDAALSQEIEMLQRQKQGELDDTPKKDHWRIHRKYDDLITQAQRKANAGLNNANTTFEFRKSALINHFTKDKEPVKLKVHHVDQGNFEKFDKDEKIVEENPLSDLIDISELSPDDFYFSTQRGLYKQANAPAGAKAATNELGHEFEGMTTSIPGAVFIKMTNQSGKAVPVKLNTAKLGTIEGLPEMIFDQIEKYVNSPNPDEFVVNDTGIKWIDDMNLSMLEFLSLFVRPRKNRQQDLMLVKNTATAYDGKFFLYTGDVAPIKISNPEQLKAAKEDIISGLADSRFYLNFSMLTPKDTGKFNKDMLKYILDNNLLNHPFNVDENFDKIYEPNYNKGIVITRPETENTAKPKKPRSYNQAVRDLKEKYEDKKANKKRTNQYEASYTSVTIYINNRIQSKFNRLRKHPANAEASDAELMDRAVAEVFEEEKAQVEELMREFPHKALNENDLLPQFLDMLDKLERLVFNSSEQRKRLHANANLYGTRAQLLQRIRNTKANRPINVLTYTDEDKSDIMNQVVSKKQFDALMSTINLLDQLTQDMPFVHISYTEDYRVKNPKDGKQPTNTVRTWEYTDDTGLSATSKTKKHYKSKLTSVTIYGNPEWVPDPDDPTKGSIKNGRVYFNVSDLQQDPKDPTKKKRNTQQILVIYDPDFTDPRLPEGIPSQNILKQLWLPFVDAEYTVDQKALDTYLDGIKKLKQILDQSADLTKRKLKVDPKTGLVVEEEKDDLRTGVEIDILDIGITEKSERQKEVEKAREEGKPIIGEDDTVIKDFDIEGEAPAEVIGEDILKKEKSEKALEEENIKRVPSTNLNTYLQDAALTTDLVELLDEVLSTGNIDSIPEELMELEEILIEEFNITNGQQLYDILITLQKHDKLTAELNKQDIAVLAKKIFPKDNIIDDKCE